MSTFDGETYDEGRDGERLKKQLAAVRSVMIDGRWHTLQELEMLVGRGTSASLSARIRDLRKDKFGGYTVERRYIANGVWEYRIP